MRYIFDSNVLITAHRWDFTFDGSPYFWDWLVSLGSQGVVGIPECVFMEINRSTDQLSKWLKKNRSVFFIPTEDAALSVQAALSAYTTHSERDVERIPDADPFVVAHALSSGSTVVTYETPKPNAAPHNRKIPDVCALLNVACVRFPRFLWDMR
ncbi:hypothetical protein NNJEOMEG_01256 [Fundidesulfovibrio magnetotacticus]|uniref:PIN domain-containing protein n=1 Tax=Fundidesulfovibrio magnetotacticus TaxID=2730080 RepID=A0A6V8LNY7_9BACT|nr:DUF4411 family protein [Fundidesulfovibrio magnetotacticus]GFK93424.1 hypothetical protein NNJEOMEG_01256 [Fundidesulfovibrio magnetotacticus]